jgi:hypothetical protein
MSISYRNSRAFKEDQRAGEEVTSKARMEEVMNN